MHGLGDGERIAVVPFDAVEDHARRGDSAWLVSYFKGVLEDTRGGLVTLARIISGALRKEHVAATPEEKRAQQKIIDAASAAHDATTHRRRTAAR